MEELRLDDASDYCVLRLAEFYKIPATFPGRTMVRALTQLIPEDRLVKRHRTLIAADIALTREARELELEQREWIARTRMDSYREDIELLIHFGARLCRYGVSWGCTSAACPHALHIRADYVFLYVGTVAVRAEVTVCPHATKIVFLHPDESNFEPNDEDDCPMLPARLVRNAASVVRQLDVAVTTHLPLLHDLASIVTSYIGVDLECSEQYAQLRVE